MEKGVLPGILYDVVPTLEIVILRGRSSTELPFFNLFHLAMP